MNWKLIFSLSLFGLAMAFATVYVIPISVEPYVWIVIFILCAVIIARKAPGGYFLHGLLVGIVNSIWITAVHLLLFDTYISQHTREAAQMAKISATANPRVLMAITGPVIGVISGIILGVFALIASRIVKKPPVVAGS